MRSFRYETAEISEELAELVKSVRRSETFIQATRPWWGKIPTFFTAKNYFLFSDRRFAAGWRVLLAWFLRAVVLSCRLPAEVPACDVLLSYTGNKPSSKPAMEALSLRLAGRGYRCALITKGGRARLISGGEDATESRRGGEDAAESRRSNEDGIRSTPLPMFRQLFVRGVGRMSSLRIFFTSLRDTIFLYRLLGKNRPLRQDVFQRPWNVWIGLLESAQRFEVVNWLLCRMRPRLIITTLAQSKIAAELHAAKEAKATYKVWFCNEPASHNSFPAFADEMWVWNQTVIDDFQPFIPADYPIRQEISGRAEIDFAMQTLEVLSGEEATFKQLTQGKRALLLLSEYVPGSSRIDAAPYTRQHVEWLAEVSRRCPDWWFIFKPRHGVGAGDEPGMELIRDLPNWIIPKTAIDFRHFLSWENLAAVAAGGSSGLFVAAGVGKMAIRLMTPSQPYSYPQMEAVSIGVLSPEELTETLRNFDQAYAAYKQQIEPQLDVHFPYRGHVLDRMESLCLQHLK